MSKLIIMQGLPASGKSMKAAELLKESGNAVRINRDLLRTMLHCDVWSGKKEGVTRDAARGLAIQLLTTPDVGVVIIDDCNLDTGTVERWKQIAKDCEAQVEIVRMETSLEECLLRDACRQKSVGRSVIMGMAMQYGLYAWPEKGVVICDIDGTLADCSHRLHYLQETPRNWASFFDTMMRDSPRTAVIQDVHVLEQQGHEIFLVSGRPDTYRGKTEAWLWDHCRQQFSWRALFMRQGGDHRPDTVVKEEMLRRYFPDLSCIYLVIDDRPQVIEMWRSHGLDVMDVGNGTAF